MEDNNKQQRKMKDYAQGKIYKIVCNITGKLYIGHTTQNYLSQRLSQHINQYNSYVKNGIRYVSSFKIIARGDYEIILIEKCDCDSVDELKARERHYIETLECVNKNIPLRTDKQYRQDNNDKIAEKDRVYYEKNKDKIAAQKKQYREKNKDKVEAQNRVFYEKNKDKIAARRTELRVEGQM